MAIAAAAALAEQLLRAQARGVAGQDRLGRQAIDNLRILVSYVAGSLVGDAVLLDFPARHGVLAEIEALGLDLLEIRKLTRDRPSP
jgi:hypothetical protein